MRWRGSAGIGRWRNGVEGILRLLVVSLLAWYLWQVLHSHTGRTTEVATSATLPAQLVRWSTVTVPARVHVRLTDPPRGDARDWLAALAGTGTAVGWSGAALVPSAATLEPLADPAGGADLAVAAPGHARVVLRDALGTFDTIVTGPTVTRVYLPNPPAVVEAVVGHVAAGAILRDSLMLGRLLVLGQAGWETKFAAAALEERGWKIDGLMAFSPLGVGDVRQGTIGPIDTATYAAVLAIDTVASRYADPIVQYVRSGGGLVLWAEAAKDTRLAALAPAATADPLPDRGLVPTDTAPRAVLALAPLTHLKGDGVTLEARQGRPAVAARRVGPGRVLQLGYLNTWRWRMAGVDGHDRQAINAHRDWLARLVATVAYTGRHERTAPVAPVEDAAPLATLVDRLGAASPPVAPDVDLAHLGAWVFGVVVAAALAEWASRRLRGAA